MKSLKQGLSAKTVSYILLASLLLLGIGSYGGFYFAQSTLRQYATSTSELNSKASAGAQNVTNLKKIREYLETHQNEMAKVKSVVAESKSYNYRDEAVKELTGFARDSGVGISAINFSAGSSGGQSSQGTPAATPAPAAATPDAAVAAGGASTTPAPTAVAALKSSTFSVSIKSPVGYKNLLTFISKIEQNVTKMQISNISLAKDAENDKGVTSEGFNIEVYLK